MLERRRSEFQRSRGTNIHFYDVKVTVSEERIKMFQFECKFNLHSREDAKLERYFMTRLCD